MNKSRPEERREDRVITELRNSGMANEKSTGKPKNIKKDKSKMLGAEGILDTANYDKSNSFMRESESLDDGNSHSKRKRDRKDNSASACACVDKCNVF